MLKNLWTACALLATFALPAWPASREVPPEIAHPTLGSAPAPAASWSKRTLAVGLEVDRDQARVVAYTLKDRPLVRGLQPQEAATPVEGERSQLEVALLGPREARHTRLVDLGGTLCLLHPADAEPHIEGDTIRVHRDTLVVELPELAGFDRLEIAWRHISKAAATRRVVGNLDLEPAAFAPSGGGYRYRDLLFADESVTNGSLMEPKALRLAPSVQWPEQFGDPDIFHVFGDAARAAERINVTVVPDGYTVAEKSLMESHAARLVAGFRTRSPYREFDAFINYTLVYAYSAQSGTDQCDCGVVADTAMGSRFPAAGDACGGAGNRCLYYGGACDDGRTENIVAAELRAPAHDTSILMVNTSRYGGCGGTRAVYSAGHPSANEIAIHELGHTLAGLADEYGGATGCGSWGGEVNTSTNRTVGAWPEWIDDLGPPREGGRYWDRCIYRPTEACAMRALLQPFCPVCLQRWALALYAHPRIAPTAPIRAVRPASPAVAWQGLPASFEVETRLPAGAGQSLRWYVEAPGAAEPILVAEGAPSLSWTFTEAGDHRVSVVVTAATGLIKPQRYGPNVESAVVDVEVLPLMAPPEISSPGSTDPLHFTDRATLVWEDAAFAGITAYNVYRASVFGLASEEWTCFARHVPGPTTSDATIPAPGAAFAYLVTGVNPLGEGPAGLDGAGGLRTLQTPCP